MKAFYGSRFSPNMTRTPEGFLVAHNVPIGRAGWYDYLPHEIGAEGSDIVKVHRDPDDVFNPAAMASFEGKPVTDNHPSDPDGVTPSNSQTFAKGSAQNIRRGSGEDSDLLLADLIIYDEQLIKEIEDGKREVSSGYECDYEPRDDGTYRQHGIVGNHIAVVDKGRAGERVRIKDSANNPSQTKDAPCDQFKNDDGTFKGGFDGAVKYFQCKGYGEEDAKKIAGKIAAEKGNDSKPDDGRTRKGKDSMKLPTQKRSRVTDFLAAVGLKHFAVDAEPEELMDAVDAMAEEKADETEEGVVNENKTKDEGASEPTEIDGLKKQIAELTAMVQKLASAENSEAKSAEDTIEDAIKAMEGAAGGEENNEEESHTIDPGMIEDEAGVVAPEGDRPKDALKTIDTAYRVAALRAIKPIIAAIPDPAERKKAADAAIASFNGKSGANTYAKINQATRQKAKDAAKDVPAQQQDLSGLGRQWAEKFNPHYKKQA